MVIRTGDRHPIAQQKNHPIGWQSPDLGDNHPFYVVARTVRNGSIHIIEINRY